MLSLIIFGIVALIVIVFLLIFNIKAISRPEKEELQIYRQSELPVNSATVPQAELLENRQLRKSTHESDKEIPQMSDEQYRRALRQVQSQGKKPTTTSMNRLNDTAYRTAARSMKNQTNKD